MSDHALTAENLLASLPQALKQDAKMNALAQSISELLSSRVQEIDSIVIYPNIDSMPEGLVDILAHDLKVDWYEPDYSMDVKRSQVKSSVAVHRTLGTKYAVATALSDIYPYSTVQEWFEYDGEPYHFSVFINIEDHDTDIPHSKIEKATQFYKSLRSVLDNIYYKCRSEIKIECSIGYVLYDVRLCGTYPPDAGNE